ncbi:GNAT family N-acetyltransferase [Polynucleobacter sp. AP-Reno-20A-A9]|uniref:GNAT family N-acetyltransferase n=1 Tax=Polynucleobacter sp. AP-Reno-20A-A9 TaxID=2576925 RepID=UPI001C0C0E4C|nr:GNAT family N-acetyltransferase [Polynucleobacter sp. AP-Reno-20A-A9]MBU3629266.1 GNAT family N-acetyltransferase [Polynucleobacter sp. AP-Reno-20A-A9]
MSKGQNFSEHFYAIGDGFSYIIRPIHSDDREKLIELFNQLSPESRYLRFAHAISRLPDEFLADVLELDYEKEMAFVACLDQENDNGSIIGIARYVSDETEKKCEFSISVSDQYSAHGVGMNLMEHLIKYAKQMKLQRMIGYILSTNTKMLRMTMELGFQIDSLTDEPEFKIATLNL